MSAGNHFATIKSAFLMRTRDIDATYTIKDGGISDNFVTDRVITITDPAADVTLTLPVGEYSGQRLLINFLSNASSKEITVNAATGTDWTLTTAGDYCSLEWMNTLVGWKALSSQESI